jgi:hypothetical protein
MLIASLQAAITLVLGCLLFGIPLRWRLLPLVFVGMAIGTAGWFFFYSIFALSTRRNDVFNSVTSIFYFCLPARCFIRWIRCRSFYEMLTYPLSRGAYCWARWCSKIPLSRSRKNDHEVFAAMPKLAIANTPPRKNAL